MTRLIFTHIQKAAGNSVNVFLERIRNERSANILAVTGAASAIAKWPLIRILRSEGMRVTDFDIITGHVPFSSAVPYLSPAVFVTVLRDPVDRLLSDYCSQPENRSRPDFGLSGLEERLASPTPEYAVSDLQVRMLCNAPRFGEAATPEMLAEAKNNLVARYGVVGFSDRLDEFLAALGSIYGVHHEGTSPRYNPGGIYQDMVTPRHRAMAAAHNRLDLALYEWAMDRTFAAPVRFAGRDAPGKKVITAPVHGTGPAAGKE